MTAAKTPRTDWEDFPVDHRWDHGGMSVSRQAVLTLEGLSMFSRRGGA